MKTELYIAYDTTRVIGVVTRKGKVVLDLRGKMYPKEIIKLDLQHEKERKCWPYRTKINDINVMDENMQIGKGTEEPEEILKNGRKIYARDITHLLPAPSLNPATLKKREELEDA